MRNDFNGLDEWSKNLSAKQEPLQNILDGQFFQSLIGRSKSKKEESSCWGYIIRIYHDCTEDGELISGSDGQFTGGYSVEIYRYVGDVYEFGFQDGKLVDMTRFDGELY